mgnify:CR=1 FL=1|tara:strand:- start:370 stop:714 length:345 start_codon:yes stop_codon:yes gene_type:complete
MNKLIIEHNKPKPKKVTMKEMCFKKFNDGFTVNEVVKAYGHNLGSVKYYRKKYVDEMLFKMKNYKGVMFTEAKQPYAGNEMRYGSELPTYKWDELDNVEKILSRHFKHKQLRKF